MIFIRLDAGDTGEYGYDQTIFLNLRSKECSLYSSGISNP